MKWALGNRAAEQAAFDLRLRSLEQGFSELQAAVLREAERASAATALLASQFQLEAQRVAETTQQLVACRAILARLEEAHERHAMAAEGNSARLDELSGQAAENGDALVKLRLALARLESDVRMQADESQKIAIGLLERIELRRDT